MSGAASLYLPCPRSDPPSTFIARYIRQSWAIGLPREMLSLGISIKRQVCRREIMTAYERIGGVWARSGLAVCANLSSPGCRRTGEALFEQFAGTIQKIGQTTPNNNPFYAGGVGVVNSPTVSMPTDAWNQIIVERSRTSLSIYLDRSLLLSDTSFAGSITSSTNPLLIGTRNAADGRDFAVNESMDEIAIWDRALTSSEITSLWNDGQGMLINASAVPEPSTLVFLATALVFIGGRSLAFSFAT